MSWHKEFFNEGDMTKDELQKNINLITEEILELERLKKESFVDSVKEYLNKKIKQLKKMKNTYINGLYSNG